MGVPRTIESRRFHQSALQRFEDAEILLKAGRTTGSVYLAGYGIECILKALILENLAPKARKTVLDTFRGAKAHDQVWLQEIYQGATKGPRFPRAITKVLTLTAQWSTDLRYTSRTLKYHDAASFLAAAKDVITWAVERL